MLSKRNISILLALLTMLSFGALCEDCYENVAWIVGFLGLAYFSIKTVLVIIKTIVKETTGNGDYIVPVLGICYAGFSIFFISHFILYSKDLSDIILSGISGLEMETYRRLVRAATYTTIIAFAWNFSKAFYTINSLDYGELNSQEISIKSGNVSRLKIIPEVTIRLIVATFFIYIEKSLYYNLSSLSSIINLSFFIVLLYISLLIWLYWFNYVFKEPSIEIMKLMRWQFLVGITLGFLILCLRFGNLSWLDAEWSSSIGALIYFVPAIALCYLILRVEIETWQNFTNGLSDKTQDGAD